MTVGVLFDLDGTLLDTPYLHVLAWWEAMRAYDEKAPMAKIHRAIGMGADQLLNEVLGEDRDTSHDTEMADQHDELFAKWYARLVPLPGARELLVELNGRGVRLVLASSASSRDLEVALQTLDAGGLFEATTTADDAQETKPEADLIQAALGKAHLKADQAVYVGDAVWDVTAAGRAGIPCVALECGGTSAAELLDAGAAEVWADPQDLLDHLDESVIAAL